VTGHPPSAHGGPGPPPLAIITVTHDSAAQMEAWLGAVDAVRKRVPAEICVVDSGSSPADRERMLEIARGRTDRVVLRPNIGYGAACNAGAAATTAPVLLFTNPDTRLISVPESALAPGALEGTIVGGYAVDGSGRLPAGFAAMPVARRQAAQLVLGRRARTFARAHTDPMWVSGGALMIARDDLRRLGGWAEDYFLYFEDADLCLRHRRRGGGIALSPELVVEHPRGADRSHVEGLVLRSGRRFVARHQGRRYVVALWVLLVLGYLPRRVGLGVLRRLRAPESASPPLLRLALDALVPARVERRLCVGSPPDASLGRHGTGC
jgi:N-acetylglucosaminyl-diphospho-decaprenol L-rhamnosyltransferase